MEPCKVLPKNLSTIILKLFLKLIYQNQKRFSSKDVQRDTEEDILEMLLEV